MNSKNKYKLTIPDMQTIFAVFDLKASIVQSEILSLLPEERELFLSLPLIDKARLDKIRKDINSNPIDQVLASAMIPFTYSCNNLTKMISLHPPKSAISKPSVVYIYFNMISFLYFQRQVVPSDQFSILVISLSRTVNLSACSHYATFFFQTMIIQAISYPLLYWDDQLVISVCDYISADSLLPPQFYPQLVGVCQIIFSLESKKSIKYLFFLLNKLYSNKRQCIMVEDQSDMMKLLTPFALQLHPSIFGIVSVISLVSQCPAVHDMYINFVNNLYQRFFEEPIVVGPTEVKYTLPEVTVLPIDEDVFLDKEISSFKNGFLPLPSQFFDVIEIMQKFPSSIWGYLSVLAPFLRKSGPECVNFFFSSLYNFVFTDSIDQTIFFSVAAAVIFLMKDNATPQRLQSFKEILESDKIFDPKITVFQEGGIDPVLNYFRSEIVTLFLDKDPNILISIMDKRHPLLFVEFLGRLLAENRKLDSLQPFHEFFHDLINIALLFQTIDIKHHNNIIVNARSIICRFMIEIAKFSVFRERTFIHTFCHFFFETEVTDPILYMLKINLCNCLSTDDFEDLTERISEILKKCSLCSHDNRYHQLVIKLADTFIQSMRHTPRVAEPVIKLLDYFILCFKAKPSTLLINKLLTIILYVSAVREYFTLKDEDYMAFSRYIKEQKLYNDEKFTYVLMCLLANITNSAPRCIKNTELYFIERPQFLLFFIASYGTSPDFERYLEIITNNCMYSPYTARKCHDGFFDIALLKFFANKEEENATIEHRGLTIDLKISQSAQYRFLVPLLITMLTTKTSYSVVIYLHKLCNDNNKIALSILEQAIIICSTNFPPCNLISSLPIETKAVTTFPFDQKFSFSFWFQFDTARIFHSRPLITFCAFSDKKASLSVLYVNTSLTIKYNSNGTTAATSLQVPIIDIGATLKENKQNVTTWHFLGLSFCPDADDEYHIVNIFYDGNMLSTSHPIKIPLITFLKIPLDVQLGLCQSPDFSKCIEVGYISKFRCYDRHLTKDDFSGIYSECSSYENLSDMSSIDLSLKSKCFIDFYSDHSVAQHFVESFYANLNLNFLLLLKNIFTNCPLSQRSFSMTNVLFDCFSIIEKRDFSHYSILYSIFEAITNVALQQEWLDTLLVRVPLWMTCDMNSRLSIINHWSSILLANYKHLFKAKSRFTEFFVQYECCFLHEEEALIKQYLIFLSRLALLKFTNSDARVLFDVAFGSTKKKTLPFYLYLIRNVTPVLSQASQHECLIFLHALLPWDNGKNTLLIITTIHDLGIIDCEQEALLLSAQLPGLENCSNLFKELVANFDVMPKFYPLFCCLPLSLDYTCRTLVPGSLSYMSSNVNFNDELWYLWPIVLAFNIEPKFQQMVFEFLAVSTDECSDKAMAIQNICHLTTTLSATMGCPNLTPIYLQALVNITMTLESQSNVINEIINQILFCTFFHMTWQSHNELLLQEFNISFFMVPFTPFSYSVLNQKVESIQDVLMLARKSAPSFVGYQVLFTKTGQIENFSLLQSSVALLQIIREKSDYAPIIKYFAMHVASSKGALMKVFDKMKKEYTDQITRDVAAIFKSISALSESARALTSLIEKFSFDTFEKVVNQILIPQPTKRRNSVVSNEVGRSRTMSCGYPVKLRRNNPQKKFKRNQSEKSLRKYDFSAQAFWITIRKIRQVDFQISKDSIRISSSSCKIEKIINIEKVKICYLSGESMLEINTFASKSFLIDISPHPNVVITKFLKEQQFAHVSTKTDWISNFEYIIHLNRVSGRSFNSSDLYPIFPQILKSFDEYEPVSVNPYGLYEVQPLNTSVLRWGQAMGSTRPICIQDALKEQCLAPEFFFFAEGFNGSTLPNWAESPYEFVYKMRKLLESTLVTKTLPQWIDLVWGEHVTVPQKNSTLFTSPHPQKEVVVNRYSNHQIIASEVPIFFSVCTDSVLKVITVTGYLFFYRFVSSEGEISLSKIRHYRFENDYSDKYFFSCGESLLVYNRNSCLLTQFTAGSRAKKTNIICHEPNFQQFGQSFVYLEDSCSIRIENDKYFRVETDITCFAVSKKFETIAIATIDNVVHVRSTINGKEQKIVSFDYTPTKILITGCWGFIVILGEKELTILSVNGNVIKKQEFPYEINYWMPFRTVNGFDYILFQYNMDTLGAFEVMYPEKQVSLCDATDLVEAHFLMDTEILLIITKSGKIAVHPISISTLFSELR